MKQGDKFFEAGRYLDALQMYQQVKNKSDDKDFVFRRGVASYKSNALDLAIQDFAIARNLGYEKEEIYFYAAKALHAKGEFRDAAQFYKNYLRYLDNDKEKSIIVEAIKRCKYAYNHRYDDQLAFVENLGASVNTIYDELKPVQSPSSQNKYYFSSNRTGSNGGLRNAKGYKDEIYGQYSCDMYAVELQDGNWTPVSAFHPILNSPRHDLIQGFNPDGSVLYFIKSQDRHKGSIYSDTFAIDKDPEAFPKLLRSPIISELGDKDVQVFNNNTMLFASKRQGGYGGYDIYITTKDADGVWQNPMNMGPEINTAFDDVSPFLAKSGTKLYFSSDRVDGFGGSDIYLSSYNGTSWSAPENLGMPINSPCDDLSFSLSADGMTAVLSSDRQESLGGFDIFLAYYKDQVIDQLIYTENIPFLAQVSDSSLVSESSPIENIETSEAEKPIERKEFFNQPLYYNSDEIIVSPANKSKLDRIKDLMIVYPEVEVIFTGHSIQEGMREFDLYFTIKRAEKAAQYLVENGISSERIKVRGLGSNYPHTKSTAVRLAEKNNRRIDVTFVKVPNNRLDITNEMPVIADAFLDGSSETYYNTLKGLSYKIQIAQTKQMYKGDIIRQSSSGAVEKMFSDNEYVYTIGLYNSYNEAKKKKGELLRQGLVDAKIMVYMNDVLLADDQIQVLKDVYPDLLEYLKFEK